MNNRIVQDKLRHMVQSTPRLRLSYSVMIFSRLD